ncbi:UNKNOWN [Stylonychia lemnae]|uniref:Uncharacterized protein n=1 Tax=Stylonychia lemnae TaxID=5949 RepID=A0A078A486_STYLE|nr:UNKNOWN [Stylonychia lemnae]|eukprot:CDW76704.1 UNKNOWN [Stylonychia lemnae]
MRSFKIDEDDNSQDNDTECHTDFLTATLNSLQYPTFTQQSKTYGSSSSKIEQQTQCFLEKFSQSQKFTNIIQNNPNDQQLKKKKNDDCYRWVQNVTYQYHSYRTVEHMIANSIQGFLIWVLKTQGSMYDEQIMPYLKDVQKCIKKPNGTEYSSEARRIIRGILNQNTRLFTNDICGRFTLNNSEEIKRYLSEQIIRFTRLRKETEEKEGKPIPPYTNDISLPCKTAERAEVLFDFEFTEDEDQEQYLKQILDNMSDDDLRVTDQQPQQQTNNPEDPSYFSNQSTASNQPASGKAQPLRGPNGKKVNTNYQYDKALNLFSFLEDIVDKMPQQSINKTHQDPLLFVKDLKDKDLIELLNSKEQQRFKGMMEFYSIFRDIIAHERMSDLHDKYGKMAKMATQLDEMCKQVNYVDEAMRFISTHMLRETSSFIKTPFIDNSQNQQLIFGTQQKVPGGGHVLSSGIKIFNNNPTSNDQITQQNSTIHKGGRQSNFNLNDSNKFKVRHQQR